MTKKPSSSSTTRPPATAAAMVHARRDGRNLTPEGYLTAASLATDGGDDARLVRHGAREQEVIPGVGAHLGLEVLLAVLILELEPERDARPLLLAVDVADDQRDRALGRVVALGLEHAERLRDPRELDEGVVLREGALGELLLQILELRIDRRLAGRRGVDLDDLAGHRLRLLHPHPLGVRGR